MGGRPGAAGRSGHAAVEDSADAYRASGPTELFARPTDPQPVFLEHVPVPVTAHGLDLAVLGARADRLVPVAGVDSRGQLPHRTADAPKALLGAPRPEVSPRLDRGGPDTKKT
ncbi:MULTISPECIES: hypothetical protein [unclassified Nocardiopsis]|uniref:hypothetical protein n=1 Tax=unclassified Nocardiopsis TaxID=2649073 RepID=UPI0013573C47|nr:MULTISPECIES: hypothetical protein [unclassified Nocardiopsis]